MAVSKPSQVRTPLVQGRGREGDEAAETSEVIFWRASWGVPSGLVAREGAGIEKQRLVAFQARVEARRWPGRGRESRGIARVI